ncbi:MAG: hypothetical protein ACRDPO_37575 [Streptosporangiaceae bacterium]
MAVAKRLPGPPPVAGAAPGAQRSGLTWRLARKAAQRLSWGVADQGMSSISNFAVNIYIARTLGATQYGAFALAYVTYSFALNASRGLATDPLLVRYSGTDVPTWRRAVSDCTGTASVVGFATGCCVLLAALVMSGATRMAFLALGLTLPFLLLQDSWRFAFFALGRGSQAFLNDTVWVVALIPGLLMLRMYGHASVFWFVFVWGLAAGAGAAVGPLQARVMPRLTHVAAWVSRHRDLGPRYLMEGTANSASSQLRNYALGLTASLAAVGYVQAASTLMGPFMVVFFGMGLVTLPEATRVWRRSPRHLPLFCGVVSLGLAIAALLWGVVLLVTLPMGLGHFMLGSLWRPTYPLVLPFTISVIGGCVISGAGIGLHALGAAKRSLRAMVWSSAINIAGAVTGAVLDGALGTVIGLAIGTWIGVIGYWWQLRVALREAEGAPADHRFWPARPAGRHSATAEARPSRSRPSPLCPEKGETL